MASEDKFPIANRHQAKLSFGPSCFANSQARHAISCFLRITSAHIRSSRVRKAERRAVPYSTVTDFARLRGWSTSQPRKSAMERANSCSGTLAVMGVKQSRTFGM